MGDILNTTNTIISIIGGAIGIFTTIVGLLKKRQKILSSSQYQSPEVRAEIQDRWTGLGFFWKIWMGILLGTVFAIMFTVIPFFVITGFIASYTNTQTHQFTNPDYSNPVLFAITAIFGVSIGITAGVSIATGKQRL